MPATPPALRVDAGEATHGILAALIAAAGQGGAGLDLTAAFDPLATLAAGGVLARGLDDHAETIAATIHGLDRLGLAGAALIADGRIWHDAGASEAEELALVLAGMVAGLRLIEAAGIAPAEAAPRIGAALAADAEQMLVTAKFRAFRQMYQRLAEAARLPEAPCRLHGETSWRMMSRREPQVNVLRATAAAFAAGTGGADSVTVLPHDLAAGTGDAHARRLARNTQTILVGEAHAARVGDPGAGSGAIEALTADLAAAAWARFQAIEAAGGLLEALRAGTVQTTIAAMRAARAHQVATRARLLTGVSLYPDLDAPPGDRAAEAAAQTDAALPHEPPAARVDVAALTMTRLAEPFEALRARADALAQAVRRPTIVLIALDRPAAVAEAVSLATNIFAAGGIAATEAGPFADPAAAIAAFAEAATPLACLCAPPKATLDAVAPLAAALKQAGAAAVYVAGLTAPATALRAAGIDAALGDGGDVVAMLGGALARFG